MGLQKKSDGRYIVGMGISDANEYKGSLAFREITIQLTESGATEQSIEYLNYLKDYAIYHQAINEPIKPPNLDIWISGNGFSKSVQADDIKITESGFEIGGITYDGSTWDYSNAGQGSGGGSSLPDVTSEDNGKILGVENGEWSKANPELPTVSSEDNGKLLGVQNAEWGVVNAPVVLLHEETIQDDRGDDRVVLSATMGDILSFTNNGVLILVDRIVTTDMSMPPDVSARITTYYREVAEVQTEENLVTHSFNYHVNTNAYTYDTNSLESKPIRIDV